MGDGRKAFRLGLVVGGAIKVDVGGGHDLGHQVQGWILSPKPVLHHQGDEGTYLALGDFPMEVVGPLGVERFGPEFFRHLQHLVPGTNTNWALGSMNLLMSHGQATR